ncbi:MAG TPA: nuclear transport factor 2 family protein [Candidatus Binataceae bacterium]|nr:nuclear transport factor 2 family protein [Candidatus Binataceae bacterium]
MGNFSGTIEDREEIRDLYARYADTLDNRHYQEWIDLFTEDGSFESTRFGKHSGREGLEKFTRIYRDSLGGAQSRHVIANVLFTIDGDHGEGSCYLLYYHCKEGRVQQSTIANYRDTLRRDGGRWRFHTRKVCVDGRA